MPCLFDPAIFDDHSMVFDHDCFDNSVLTSFGRTSTGLDVVLNGALKEADAAIVSDLF